MPARHSAIRNPRARNLFADNDLHGINSQSPVIDHQSKDTDLHGFTRIFGVEKVPDAMSPCLRKGVPTDEGRYPEENKPQACRGV
jgi:hypothetical protein